MTESVCIASYLIELSGNKSGLLGRTREARALVQMWCSFGNMAIMQTLAHWIVPLLGFAPYNRGSNEYAKKKTLDGLTHLDETLKDGREWLVGGSVTLGDVFVASMVMCGLEFVLDAEWRERHPTTMSWLERVVSQPQFARVIDGKVKMCEKALQPPKAPAA